MTSFTNRDMERIEQRFRFQYPPSFRRHSSALSKLLEERTPEFGTSRLVTDADEIVNVRWSGSNDGFLPETLLPFLVQEEPEETAMTAMRSDWYCFDLESQGQEWRVVVFSIHAIVADWRNFEAWFEWLQNLRSN